MVEEATRLNQRVHRYGRDLPAAIHGLRAVRLVAGGWVEVEVFEASADDVVSTHRLRPQDVRTWRELLRETFTMDDAFTLGDLMRLCELPTDVDREVYLRCTPYSGDLTLADWRRAVLADYIPPSPENVVVLEVYPCSGEAGEPFMPGWDLHGLGAPLTAAARAADEQLAHFDDGHVVAYALDCLAPATLRDLPLRVAPTFTIDAPHDEVMAFYRRRRGHPDAERPAPRYVGPMACTLRDFIGAILGALRPSNTMGGLLRELRERVAELQDAESPTDHWSSDELFRAIAGIIEPLHDASVPDTVLLPLARALSAAVRAAMAGPLSRECQEALVATCVQLREVGADLVLLTEFQVTLHALAVWPHPRPS